MEVSVLGQSPHVDVLEWRRATKWYGEHLMGHRMARNVRVKIELMDYIRGRCGSVSCLDWVRPRSFVIQIETGGGKRVKQLRTLAHEMVHVRQLVRGEMRMDWPEPRWRSKIPVSSRFEDCPWEEEAYGREVELFREYTRQNS